MRLAARADGPGCNVWHTRPSVICVIMWCMEKPKRQGPKTTAEIAARERGVLRRGDNHILRDENDVPIDGYRPPTRGQLRQLGNLAERLGTWPGWPANNVAAADLIRRLERRAAA